MFTKDKSEIKKLSSRLFFPRRINELVDVVTEFHENSLVQQPISCLSVVTLICWSWKSWPAERRLIGSSAVWGGPCPGASGKQSVSSFSSSGSRPLSDAEWSPTSSRPPDSDEHVETKFNKQTWKWLWLQLDSGEWVCGLTFTCCPSLCLFFLRLFRWALLSTLFR